MITNHDISINSMTVCFGDGIKCSKTRSS